MFSQFFTRHQRSVQIVFWLTLIAVLGLSLWPIYFSTLDVNWSDKLEHFLAYLALGTLLGIGWSVKGARPFLAALLALIILGGAIEIMQGTCWIGRTASWLDLLADALGAAFGLGAARGFFGELPTRSF